MSALKANCTRLANKLKRAGERSDRAEADLAMALAGKDEMVTENARLRDEIRALSERLGLGLEDEVDELGDDGGDGAGRPRKLTTRKRRAKAAGI